MINCFRLSTIIYTRLLIIWCHFNSRYLQYYQKRSASVGVIEIVQPATGRHNGSTREIGFLVPHLVSKSVRLCRGPSLQDVRANYSYLFFVFSSVFFIVSQSKINFQKKKTTKKLVQNVKSTTDRIDVYV